MLEKLLTPEDCVACKWCCKFNEEDLFEQPQIYEETAAYIRKNFRGQSLCQKDGLLYFDMPRVYCEQDEEYQYTCPMLRDGEGCALGEARMLDCKIWPFRIMECPGGLAITLSGECKVMNEKADEELMEELLGRGTAKLIFRAAEERPAMVKPYRGDHRILLYKKDFENE